MTVLELIKKLQAQVDWAGKDLLVSANSGLVREVNMSFRDSASVVTSDKEKVEELYLDFFIE